MSSIHYKFKATLEYKTLSFDGLHISVNELKREICEKENIKVSYLWNLFVSFFFERSLVFFLKFAGKIEDLLCHFLLFFEYFETFKGV